MCMESKIKEIRKKLKNSDSDNTQTCFSMKEYDESKNKIARLAVRNFRPVDMYIESAKRLIFNPKSAALRKRAAWTRSFSTRPIMARKNGYKGGKWVYGTPEKEYPFPDNIPFTRPI